MTPGAKAARGRPERHRADYRHPPCPGCGKPVERRPGEIMSAWVGRVCCDKFCSARASSLRRQAETAEKVAAAERIHPVCAECNSPVVHRENEPLDRYADRKTCSNPVCRKAYLRRRSFEAGLLRRERGLENYPADQEVKLEREGVDFGGSFARFDIEERPRYGRVLSGIPPHRTYAGVVSYGR